MPKSTATFTAAAAAIGAGDVMGGAQVFSGVGPATGGLLRILRTELLIEVNALQSGEAGYTLHLYSATPPSALADNAVWDLPAGDRDVYIDSIALGTPVDVGGTLYKSSLEVNLDIFIPTGNFWAYLETDAAFTATAVDRNVTLYTFPLRG